MIRCPGSAPLCEAAGHFSGQPGGNIKIEHDEVNYAVSEKESGFSGVMGVNENDGLYWAAVGCTGTQMGCTGMYCAVLNCTGLY